MEPDMLGREAAPLAPTPIRKARTPRERCCASSSSIASLRKSEAPAGYLNERIAACQLGLEGIVSKRLDSRYTSGRTTPNPPNLRRLSEILRK